MHLGLEKQERPALHTLALVLFGTITVYALVWPLTSGDMLLWLVPWYEHILGSGQVAAFSEPFGNYTPPYLYLLSATTLLDGALPAIWLIKALSVLGACGLAAATYYLLRALGALSAAEGGAWVLLLPTVIFNAPILGQCDVIWTAACLMALAEAVKDRTRRMLFWCGVAVAFKAQAVFIAPFILAVLVARRTPLHLWAIPPLVYSAAMVPAWAAGWPVSDLATIYLRQAEWSPEFIGNAANPWSIAEYLGVGAVAANHKWVGFAAAAFAILSYLAFYRTKHLSPHQLLAAALLSSIMLPWLLPKMHERFFFLADMLAFVFAWTLRSRHAVAVAILVQFSSIMTAAGLLGWSPGAPLGCAMTFAACLMLLSHVYRESGESVRPTLLAPPRRAPA